MADLDGSFVDSIGLGRVRAHGKLGHLLDQGVIGINRTKSPERCPRGSTGQGGTDREKNEESRAFEHGSPVESPWNDVLSLEHQSKAKLVGSQLDFKAD